MICFFGSTTELNELVTEFDTFIFDDKKFINIKDKVSVLNKKFELFKDVKPVENLDDLIDCNYSFNYKDDIKDFFGKFETIEAEEPAETPELIDYNDVITNNVNILFFDSIKVEFACGLVLNTP